MRIKKIRYALAGLVAFLLGMPLAEDAHASDNIVFSALDLGFGLASLAGDS